jgi:glycyl-tRNA synthetase beta chain
MEAIIRKELTSARLVFGEVKTLATPRRLVLVVKDIPQMQPDAEITASGPSKKAAFDDNGKPTKAAEGFARGQGVDVSQLQIITSEKGEYLAVTKLEQGRPVVELLQEMLPALIANIPFKKSMHWGALDVRFARPIHWIIALFDGAVVPFSFGNIESGRYSRGHRFMANATFDVQNFQQYLEQCEKHFVIPDPERRKEIIRSETLRIAGEAGGNLLPDEELLEQVFIELAPPPPRVPSLLDRMAPPTEGPVLIIERPYYRAFAVSPSIYAMKSHGKKQNTCLCEENPFLMLIRR